MERKGLVLIMAFLTFTIFTPVAYATVFFDNGRFELEGVVWNQNIWRSNDLIHNYEFIQGRTQADLKLLFHVIGEKGYLKDLLFIDGIDLRTIGRGAYDYMYDFTNTWGAAGNFFSKDVERHIKEDLDLREAYADIRMGPLALRLGKQQIVWGKTDFFRLLDVINPLDYSWHFFFEGFDDIRIPQIMGKALLSLGNIGFLRDVSLEFVANPRDFNSTELGRFGQPWALAPAGFKLIPKFQPHDKWQFGGRIQARAGSFNFTINDYYARMESPAFDLYKGGLVYPRVNILGGSVDYYENWSKSVLRLELAYINHKKMGIDFTSRNAGRLLAENPNGIPENDEIEYCIGIDRSTFIRFLNPNDSFFLSVQLFMTHILDYKRGLTLDGSPVKQAKPVFTFIASTPYMHGRLLPSIYWAADIQGNSHVVGPSIQYLINNHFNIKVGANIIWGSKSRWSMLGAFKDYDEAYVKFQFNF